MSNNSSVCPRLPQADGNVQEPFFKPFLLNVWHTDRFERIPVEDVVVRKTLPVTIIIIILFNNNNNNWWKIIAFEKWYYKPHSFMMSEMDSGN